MRWSDEQVDKLLDADRDYVQQRVTTLLLNNSGEPDWLYTAAAMFQLIEPPAPAIVKLKQMALEYQCTHIRRAALFALGEHGEGRRVIWQQVEALNGDAFNAWSMLTGKKGMKSIAKFARFVDQADLTDELWNEAAMALLEMCCKLD